MGTRWTSDEYKRHIEKTKQKQTVGKYGNEWTQVDGINFQSKKESERYIELKSLQRSGAIIKFKLQVVYELIVKRILICRYVADFVVWHKDGTVEVEDVKSDATRKIATFVIKKKLMLAIHGITIKII